MRNPKQLEWWAMIQSVAYFGWGVGRVALNATNCWGVVCSSKTRDRLLAKLTEGFVEV